MAKAKTVTRPAARPEPAPQAQASGAEQPFQDLHGVQASVAPPIPGVGHNSGPAGIPLIPGRAVGISRSGKPVQRAAAETGVDEFFIPANLPPQGWSWEWKRELTRGQPDPYYMSRLGQVGWE